MQRNSWRERKRVGVQVDEYAPIISEILYAFQEARVLRVIEAITAIGPRRPSLPAASRAATDTTSGPAIRDAVLQ